MRCDRRSNRWDCGLPVVLRSAPEADPRCDGGRGATMAQMAAASAYAHADRMRDGQEPRQGPIGGVIEGFARSARIALATMNI